MAASCASAAPFSSDQALQTCIPPSASRAPLCLCDCPTGLGHWESCSEDRGKAIFSLVELLAPSSKLQKTKRDSRWLHGVTGEWFEEIQRKKFCNERDVSQMLKQPLTHRLRKGMAENDPMELQTSRSKNTPNQRNPTSIPFRLSFRSSLASLFSFRKSRKEPSKPQTPGQRGWDGHTPPMSVRGTTLQAKINNSSLENQPVDSAFVPKPASMREGSGVPPWDASRLEDEFFQVLDDLDSKLAQEQSSSSVNIRTPLNYGSRTQFSPFYSSENRHGTLTGRHRNCYLHFILFFGHTHDLRKFWARDQTHATAATRATALTMPDP